MIICYHGVATATVVEESIAAAAVAVKELVAAAVVKESVSTAVVGGYDCCLL